MASKDNSGVVNISVTLVHMRSILEIRQCLLTYTISQPFLFCQELDLNTRLFILSFSDIELNLKA